jgi:hypothetical protein
MTTREAFSRIRGIPSWIPRLGKKALIRFLIVVILTVLFFLIPREYLGEKYPLCLFRLLFKKHCIGCGTTRAFWSVLHLRFRDAFAYNRLVVITFPLCVGCLLHWVFVKK